MNWTGGPNAWACWAGADIQVGTVTWGGVMTFRAAGAYGQGLGVYITLEQAKQAVERAAGGRA